MNTSETPAAKVRRLLGGIDEVKKVTGLKSTLQVRRWDYPKSKGGHDGQVPPRHHAAILKHATEKGIPLTPFDLMPWMRSAEPQRLAS